jgi:cytochrome c biogenesis protein CcdA
MSRATVSGQHRRMPAVTVLVTSLGLADSLNPVTILIAVYLGAGPDPVRRLSAFAVGVLAAYFLGGVALMLGPAELLRAALDGVEIPGADVAALAAGAGLVIAAVALWMRRARLARVRLPRALAEPRSALVLGAVVTALDLPTAFPYFAAIAVIVGADVSLPAQVLLLGLFNVLYVLPIVLVLVARLVFGARCQLLMARVTAGIERIAGPLLAAGTCAIGCALVVHGARGLLG